MFQVGVPEMVVLAIVAVVVIGPERLPQLAREAAQLLRTLREMATGARAQLRDELGPEFADVDLRNLNPRTALTRAVFGDEEEMESLRKMDPRRWDARSAARDFMDPGLDDAQDGSDRVDMHKSANGSAANGAAPNGAARNGASRNGVSANGASANGAARPRPRPRPRPAAPAAPAVPYDDDAT